MASVDSEQARGVNPEQIIKAAQYARSHIATIRALKLVDPSFEAKGVTRIINEAIHDQVEEARLLRNSAEPEELPFVDSFTRGNIRFMVDTWKLFNPSRNNQLR